MGASRLPVVADGAAGFGSAGALFFRILYVEGGGDSSMFRCKTTIFKSELVHDSADPVWNSGCFNFEMVLPSAAESVRGKKKPTAADLKGEILVAVYRTRGVSGNDFVGQVSFDIASMLRKGLPLTSDEDVVEGDVPVQTRVTAGLFPLTNRSGKLDEGGQGGHIQADMKLRWRGVTVGTKAGKGGGGTIDASGLTGAGKGKAKPVLGGRNAPALKKHVERAKKITTARNSSGYGTQARTLADVQKGNNKMVNRKFEAGLMDKQNELYMRRIAKARGNPSATKKLEKAYEAERPKLVERERKEKAVSSGKLAKPPSKVDNTWDHMYTESEEAQEKRRRAEVRRPKDDGPRPDPRQKQRQAGEASLLEQRDDLAKQVATLQTTNKDLYATETRLVGQLKRYETTVRRVKEGMAQGGLKQPSASVTGPGESSRPAAVTHEAVALAAENIQDAELKDMLEEHEAMQAVRRPLVSRVHAARAAIATIEGGLAAAEQRQLRAWERLGQNEILASARGAAAVEDDKWLATKVLGTLEKEQQTIVRLEAQRCEGLHLVVVESELAELSSTKTALGREILTLEDNISKLQYERDMWHERYDSNAKDNMISLLRGGIKQMRIAAASQRRAAKLEDVEAKADKLELALLRFKLQQAQANVPPE